MSISPQKPAHLVYVFQKFKPKPPKFCESLQLHEDYEKSFQIYKAALPDPDLPKKEAKEKSSKEAIAKQLKQEKELQKQEAASKAKEEKIRKDLRAQVVETQQGGGG